MKLKYFLLMWCIVIYQPFPVEARNLMIVGGGVPVAAECTVTLKDSDTGKEDYDHFGNVSTRTWVAGKIVPSTDFSLVRFELGMSKTNSPTASITGYVYNKSGDGEYPGASLGQADATYDSSTLSTTNTETYAQFNFATPISLTTGTTYYLVVKSSAVDAGNYMEIYHSNGEGGKALVESSDGATWASIGAFSPDFKTYSCE